MKVVLQKNVHGLGKAGDVVEAASGYFRNFLQPRSLAVLATEGALKKREEDLEALRKKAQDAHEAAVALSERVQSLGNLRLTAKAGEGGRLYGKVTTKDVAELLSQKLETEIDKRHIRFAEDVGALGTYKVIVKLTSDVHADISIDVLPEGTDLSAATTAGDKQTEAVGASST